MFSFRNTPAWGRFRLSLSRTRIGFSSGRGGFNVTRSPRGFRLTTSHAGICRTSEWSFASTLVALALTGFGIWMLMAGVHIALLISMGT